MAIIVPINAEWNNKDLQKAIKEIGAAQAKFSSVGSSAKGAGSQFDALGSTVKKLGGLFAAAFSVQQVASFFKESIKGAIDDSKAQAILAKTLQNTTNATKQQISSVESYIDTLQRATGVADDELRPSLGRLVRATGDISKAQQLQQLALDVSAGSGKDLTSVTEALSKAYVGNFGAIKKLGISVDDAIIKNKDFKGLSKALADQFEGQSANAANTLSGRIARLGIAYSEVKESIGNALLPIVEKFLGVLVNKGIPAFENAVSKVQDFAKSFEPTYQMIKARILPILEFWWNFISQVIIPGIVNTVKPIISGLKDAFEIVGQAIERNREKIQPFLEFLVSLANFIYSSLAPVIGQILGGALKTVGKIIGAVIDIIAKALPVLTTFLTNAVNTAVKVINFFIEKYNALPQALKIFGTIDKLSEVTFPKFEQSGKSAFENVAKSIDETATYTAPAFEEMSGNIDRTAESMKKAKKEAEELKKKLIDAQEVIVNNLKNALDKASASLDDIKGKFKDFKDAIKGTITGILDFGKAAEDEKFLDGLVKQATQGKIFADKLKQLITLGLSESAIRKVLDAGVEAGTKIADQIIEGGKTVVDQVNELVGSVETVAEQVGMAGAEMFYQKGVDSAQALVNGLQAELDAAEITLANIKVSGEPGTGTTTTTTTDAPKPKTPIKKPTPPPPSKPKTPTVQLQNKLQQMTKSLRLAEGAIIKAPTLATIGEAGPEAVIPLTGSKSQQMKLGGATFNIVVNAGIGTSGRQVGAQIVEAIKKYENASGQVFARA